MATESSFLEGRKSNGKVRHFPRFVEGASQPDLTKLARLIAAYAPHDGSFDLRIPGVHASRYSRVNYECVHALSVPSL